MKTSFAIVFALALAISASGCIQNMATFKDRLGGEDLTPAVVAEPTPTDTSPPPSTPVAEPSEAPVARIAVFGANGALLFKSSFTAEDPKEILLVEVKTKLSFIAGDSATVEPGATITGFAWTLNGAPLEGARQASTEFAGPGLYTLTLVITDSNGKTDAQTLKLGVQPQPYDVVTNLTSGAIVGASSQGESSEIPFELKLPTDITSKITGMTIAALPGVSCDITMEVVGPDGNTTGVLDDGGVFSADQTETATFGPDVPLGVYTIMIGPFACAAPEGVPITVTVTYLEVVPGLDGTDGHGHAH